jgi:flagellar basal-body rod protein FlgB
MTSPIDSSTLGLLGLALDAAAMRQQALAHNIANANTPGYQRIAVSFEQRLDALRSAGGQVAAPSLADLASLRPVFEPAEGPVLLDAEVAALSENTLHQNALLKAVSRQYALIGLAINEGKR